jgi:hypothetical protein
VLGSDALVTKAHRLLRGGGKHSPYSIRKVVIKHSSFSPISGSHLTPGISAAGSVRRSREIQQARYCARLRRA